MLRIEARRSLGLWLFPFVAALVVYTTYESLPKGIWLWPHTSVAIRATLLLVGPLTAGLAAWAAGRTRRRGMGELLATTAQPAAFRDLTTWGATTVWYGIAYLLAAAFVLLQAYWGGAWGSPILWPVLLGLLAVCADSALGYAVGYFLPTYLTAPLVAVTLYVAHGIALSRPDFHASYLSPVASLDQSVFFGVLPNVFVGQSLWFLGVAGVALSLMVLRGSGRSIRIWATLLTAAIITAVGVIMLFRTPLIATPAKVRQATAPYDPVCMKDRLPVCLHPADNQLLPKTNAVVNQIAEPLTGVSGGPTRARQSSGYNSELKSNGTLTFPLYDMESTDRQLPTELVIALVQDSSSDYAKKNGVLSDAQTVLAAWLLEKSGRNSEDITYRDPKITSVAKRFARLSPKEQNKWLDENYANLRAGTVTTEKLP